MVMEILLLIAVIAVAVSALYVAANFNKRTRQNFTPLMDDVSQNIAKRIAATRGQLEQQMTAITKELMTHREILRNLEAISGELREQVRASGDDIRHGKEPLMRLETTVDELRQKTQSITDEVRLNSELVKRFEKQLGAHQERLDGDVAQLDRRFTEFNDSLARQNSRISGIYKHVISQVTSDGSPAESDSLLPAMLEAESRVDDKGWGGQPHLYALTEELALLDQWPLADGDLADVLTGIRWPADVAGCVLITELATLSARGEEGASVDPVAPVDWTSTHPDGRAARLAVGVRRSGEYTCGLRIKGEDGLRIRIDLAGDLVAALLHTF
jgi:gas vesicle protein